MPRENGGRIEALAGFSVFLAMRNTPEIQTSTIARVMFSVIQNRALRRIPSSAGLRPTKALAMKKIASARQILTPNSGT